MSEPAEVFARDYGEARELFLAAARAAGATLEAHRHPLGAPDGGALHADVAWLGPRDATRVVLTVSATHGVEGFAGSACQTDWLIGARKTGLPRGVSMMILHAVNPHGFARRRRVNEDNVDINRNFIDFTAPPPENEGWRRLAPVVCPEVMDDGADAAYRALSRDFIQRHGERDYVRAVSGGQYSHPGGVFHGGGAPVWSHRLLRRLTERWLAATRHLAVVDIHTGLGPWGHGELICRHPPESDALSRARRWYGDGVTSPALDESASPVATGNLRMAFALWRPEIELTAVGLEFGTYPAERVFEAIRADNWLHIHGRLDSRRARAIKAEIREMFDPDDDGWRRLVLARGAEVQRRALDGLARP